MTSSCFHEYFPNTCSPHRNLTKHLFKFSTLKYVAYEWTWMQFRFWARIYLCAFCKMKFDKQRILPIWQILIIPNCEGQQTILKHHSISSFALTELIWVKSVWKAQMGTLKKMLCSILPLLSQQLLIIAQSSKAVFLLKYTIIQILHQVVVTFLSVSVS